jgi:2-amino-4-hydroxy-6-hydroxymethyldihydropteridine diphosphokinase
MEQKIYLSLGSNVGDRATNLTVAIAALDHAGVHVEKISSIYETEPVDYLEQEWFLNCVVEGTTALAALELLQALRRIETRMGSKKPFAKGPRLLDLDILLYASESIDTEGLRVPHPRMLQRNFVMAPLAEIAPQLRHPSWHGTAKEMLERTGDKSVVRPAAS